MNPKFTRLVQFTLEIFLLWVLVAKFTKDVAGASESAIMNESHEAQPGAAKGSGLDTVRVTMEPSIDGSRIYTRNVSAPFTGADGLAKLVPGRPDRIVIQLEGQKPWLELLRYAIDNDIPVSVELPR